MATQTKQQDRNTMPQSLKALVLFQQFVPVPGRPAFYCAYLPEKSLSVKGITNLTFPSQRDGKGNGSGDLDHIVPLELKQYPLPDNIHNLQYLFFILNQAEKQNGLSFHAKFELLRRGFEFPKSHLFHKEIDVFVESIRRSGKPTAFWPFWAYRADGTPRLWGYSLKEKRFVLSPEESYFLEARSKAARVCAAVDALPKENIIAQMVLEEFEKQYGVDPYEIKQDDLI